MSYKFYLQFSQAWGKLPRWKYFPKFLHKRIICISLFCLCNNSPKLESKKFTLSHFCLLNTLRYTTLIVPNIPKYYKLLISSVDFCGNRDTTEIIIWKHLKLIILLYTIHIIMGPSDWNRIMFVKMPYYIFFFM